MKLVRWDPFRDFANMQNQLGRLMSDFPAMGEAESTFGSFVPAIDVFERGDELVFRAEVPGIDKDKLNVEVEDGTLMISGERTREEEIKESNAYRLERSYGKFSRSFTLPGHVDVSKVDAKYKNGVLELTFPKLEVAKPKKIEIHS